MLVASPEYLARRGTPRRVQDLSDHDCILMEQLMPHGSWPMPGPKGKPVRIPVQGRVSVSSMDTARAAAEAGMGIAMLIDIYALPELAAGTLVEVLPGSLGPPSTVFAVAPVRRHRSPAVRALLEHMIEAFPRRLVELRTRPHVRARGVGRDRG